MGRLNCKKPMSEAAYAAYDLRKHYERQRRAAVQASRAAQGIHIKVCNKCEQEQPLTVEFFKPAKASADGFGYTCTPCIEAKKKAYKVDPAKSRARSFKTRHGYSREERDIVLASTKHCEICGSMKLLVVDHCHNSRKIRGTLCTPCNTGMGQLDDNPDLLEAAAAYLRKSGNHRSGPRRGVKSEKWRALKKALANSHSSPCPSYSTPSLHPAAGP